MSKNRRSPKRVSARRPLEVLESRRLLSGVSWSDVLTYDEPLSVNSVPVSGPVDGESYTIRALVEYYNTSYTGVADESFTIQLQPNTTYTLSNSTDTSSVQGGRNNEDNEYGALDIQPTGTTAPLIVAGSSGTVLTCILVGPNSDIPLDRLIHVISGSLQLQRMTLTGGLALDNGTGSASTDALGGGVLVNPDATLSLTNCSILSNAASGVSPAAGASGLNAAGGGIYASAGSVLNVNGSTSFTNNRVFAGRGGSSGSAGKSGGNALGGGLAMAADVGEPSSSSGKSLVTTLSFTVQSTNHTVFMGNRLNLRAVSSNSSQASGGTGGTGTQTGGTGGKAHGAGLYLGSGQLNLDGGSLALEVFFAGNQAQAGRGGSSITSPGNGGEAFGAGASLIPGQVSVSNAPTSGGILQFANNTTTSYSGSTAATANSGLYLPSISVTNDQGYTSAEGPWSLRTAVAVATALASTGMDITLTLPALSNSEEYTLIAATGNNSGSLAVSDTGAGSLAIAGGGKSDTIIDASGLGESAFSFSSSKVGLSGLTITGAKASGNGGALLIVDSTVTLSSVNLKENQSTDKGGGLYQSGGTLRIENSKIIGNRSSDSGGGLYVQDANTVSCISVLVSDNQVDATGNAAGGGLYVSGGTLNLNNVTVRANQITASKNIVIQGGGLYASGTDINLIGGPSVLTVFEENSLSGNGTGTGFGAGISLINSNLDVNSGLSLASNSITEMMGGVGGAIAFFNNTTYNVVDTPSLTGNEAISGGDDYAFLVTNLADGNNTSLYGPYGIGYFTGGTGTLRGAINYCQNEFGTGSANSLAIILSSGTYSVSSAYGQLVTSVPAGDSLTIIGQEGGAVLSAGGTSRVLYVQNSGSLILQSLGITGGHDSSSGGGIYQQSGTLTLANVTVKGNYAGQSGTATNNFPVVTNTTWPFYSGTTAQTGAAGASGYGGGIYLNAGTLNLTGSTTITNNTVQGQNGAQGQDGGAGTTILYGFTWSGASFPTLLNGQNGGTGGAGGAALGGGLYQAGGTLNSPSVTSMIFDNTALPGTGGAGGSGGAAAVHDGETVGKPGTAGASGANGASCSNYYDAVNPSNSSAASVPTTSGQGIAAASVPMTSGQGIAAATGLPGPSSQATPAAVTARSNPVTRKLISLLARYVRGFIIEPAHLPGDNVTDLLLLSRTGTPTLFLVDGRTGAVTPISGKVSAGLRQGMTVKTVTLSRGGGVGLVLQPKTGRPAKLAVVDLRSDRVSLRPASVVLGSMSRGARGARGARQSLRQIRAHVAPIHRESMTARVRVAIHETGMTGSSPPLR